jgi:hypothetical protein
MSEENIKDIINQYFDNELTKGEEVILFTQLSQDDEAREYFKEMNLLRTVSESTLEEFPDILDDKIFSQIKSEKKVFTPRVNRTKIFAAVSYGFALVLMALSFFFYNESMQYRNKLEITSQQVTQQNQMIQVLFNSLPQAEVRANFANEIIITPKM